MKQSDVKAAAIIIHRLEVTTDWVETIEQTDHSQQFWRLEQFESSDVLSFSSSFGYGANDPDGALVFSRLEMLGLLKIIETQCRERLIALGVDLEN